MISAALQRRVFLYGKGEDGGELFPNMFVCFCGPPGLGKGLILGTVARLLRFHRFDKGVPIKTSAGIEKPYLFPIGADSITFEKLLDEVAAAIRRVPKPDGTIYVHCSYSFVLEELDSLFKRKTQDVINFLKNAYDCKPYEYHTRHEATVILRFLCVSLLAGTQPDFLFEARRTGIFGQGFASRTLFLFEDQKRFSAFHITALDPDQKESEAKLLLWLKHLATVYGEVTYDESTYNFLEAWERDCLTPQEIKAPPRLKEYYARKKVTMLKLATAMHFSESLEKTIPMATFMKAIKWLDAREDNLAKGLGMTGRNELHGYVRRIHEFILSRSPVPERDVIIAFSVDMNVKEIKEALSQLEETDVVKTRLEKGNTKLYYV